MAILDYPSVKGGHNDSLFATEVALNQVQRAVNYVMSREGVLTQRGGTEKKSDTVLGNLGVWNVHQFFINTLGGVTTTVLLCKAGTVLYKFNTTTVVWDSLETGLVDNKASMVNFLDGSGGDCFVYADGTNFFRHDGTTRTNITPLSVNAPRYLEVDDNVLWSAETNAQRVYFSAANDPATLGGSIYVGSDGAGGITMLKRMENYLAVGTPKSIHIITGTAAANFARVRVLRGVGVESHWSAVAVGDGLFWVDQGGFRHGWIPSERADAMVVDTISGNIKRRFDNIKDGTLGVVEGVYDEVNGNILWGVNPSGESNHTEVLVFSLWHSTLKAQKPLGGPDQRYVWSGYWDGVVANAMAVVQETSGKNVVYFGGSDGFVQRYDPTLYKDSCAVDATTGTDITPIIYSRETYFPTTARSALVKTFFPRLFQRKNGTSSVQWVVNRSRIAPNTARTIRFYGNIPYWNGGTNSNITTKWNRTVWTRRPILNAIVSLDWLGVTCTSIFFIITGDGSYAKSDFSWSGHSLDYSIKKVRGRG